ncbi:Putative uncharacterized protein OS=Desulfitobacterium hafniense (strain Y51) GN=DSY2801 PE=4 SV=1 [Gemmataceae bacterium]|nr:Putative uncharacterized protein OS=Desulfitobacterium hafniense (strain Y51) GN=DSY2801 PE=4 SV=1 [Gemmataceae bacterium]VTT99592.1 Putative uncharacterized protein OS=Desulfitobacterium hafniense (strain Y51) GN=DSY2801 PE=4 SV=1 [Gemmataceae bacterium]
MTDVRSVFFDELSAGRQLVLMPVSRFMIEKPFRIDQFAFYPAGSVDPASLRAVRNHTLPESGFEKLEGQQLREAQSDATGASVAELGTHAIVAFTYDLDWEAFLNATHADDIELLRKLSEYADQAMDIIKLHFCTLSAPHAIPGRVGTWGVGGECLCALLYRLNDNESYLIAGRGVVSSVVVGMGLELDEAQCSSPMSLPGAGEVGNIARHGLRLYSDLMDSNSDTVKFARAMTLLEYLASPDEYKNWKKLKGDIVAHLAKSDTAYHAMCERFRELTSKEDAAGVQIGLRTLVVHHARRLQDVVPSREEREKLFMELWRYCYTVLDDLVGLAGKTREELKQHRKGLRTAIGIVNE